MSFQQLTEKIITYAKKTPYVHIGDYMSRWWIVPYRHETKLSFFKRPLGWLMQLFDIAIRIHEIKRSDDARSFHDHPWPYLTVILKGGYFEITPLYDRSGLYLGEKSVYFGPGSILFRRAKTQHRLEIHDPDLHSIHEIQATTTLFITFKKSQSWGFFPYPKNKIYYQDYLKNDRS